MLNLSSLSPYNGTTRSVQVAEWLALLTLDREVPGSNPARSGVHLMAVLLRFMEPFHYHPFFISI